MRFQFDDGGSTDSGAVSMADEDLIAFDLSNDEVTDKMRDLGGEQARFPVGGSKDAVFSFLQQRGFVMSDWSDKRWDRADGVELHLYGSGSRARLYDRTGALLADDALDAAIAKLGEFK